MRLVAGKLAALALTVVLAPTFTYVVFEALRFETPAADVAAGLGRFLEGFLLHGDLGFSYYYDAPLTTVLRDGLPTDLTMLFGGLALGGAAGVAGGMYAVARPGSAAHRVLDVLAAAGMSVPVYWLGLVALFAIDVQMRSLWVPCAVIAVPVAAGAYRMTRAATVETLGEDFVRTAYVKGLRTRRVLGRHVLPVAGIPVAVLVATQVNLMITNIALMQIAFNLPGSFRDLRDAVLTGDVALLQGLMVEGVLLVAVANTAADLLQARLDPRVRR